jgi:serine/threonine protein kinase
MDRLGPLPEDEVIILGAAICDALSYLHSRKPPVLHRDIKPGNVKITPYGQIFLVDFGLAKVVQGSQVTTTGARAMTPGYSPPEQYGTAHTDSRTDIYSLAATLYSALTDALPEDGLARAMDQADLTPIRKHNPKVTRKLASVIEKGLEVKPDNRYQTGEEFRDDLMNSKNTTRQRSDLNITPPPPVSEMVKSNGGSNGGEKTPVAESEVVEAKGNGVSIVSLPSSGPLVEGGYAPVSRPRRQKRPSMWLFIFFLLIIAVGSVGATYLYPSWPAMALAMFQPSATSTPTTEAPPPTSTAGPADTATFAPSPMPTQEVVVIEPTATASDTATATPRPTRTPTPNYTPTISPTPIGSGFGQLAIASDRSGVPEIWLVDLVGDNLTMLTNFPEGACQPSWSPDGKRLVFISPCPKNQLTYAGASMFILDIDAGTAPQPLATLPGGDFDPSWSPDG